MRHRFRNLIALLFAAVLLVNPTFAQQGKATLALFGGASGYGGDNDKNPTEGGLVDGTLKTYFKNAGPNLGLELGYGLSDRLSAVLRGAYGWYPNIESVFPAATQQEGRLTGSLMLRYQIFSYLADKAISPYIQFGANLTQASKQSSPINPPTGDKASIGYGPTMGLGIQFNLGRIHLGIDGSTALVTPDVAVDGSNPNGTDGVNRYPDETNFDILNYVSGHLRFDLREGKVCSPATLAMLNGPATLNVNESASFTTGAIPTATQPVSYMWDFGDGSTGTGATAAHTFAKAGTYTVTSSAMNCRGTSTLTKSVTVVDPCASNPAKISAANAPATLEVGKSGSFTASATGSCAVAYAWDFGNGAAASTANASQSFGKAGTYTVKVTATNQAGSDSRTFRVTVNAPAPPPPPPPPVDPCTKLTELNSVYFGYGAATLDAQATSLLDENVDALKGCQNVKVSVSGYSDTAEKSLSLSQRRAKAVADYYTSKGITVTRITTQGAGVDATAVDKEDAGPGNRRGRRAESVPVK